VKSTGDPLTSGAGWLMTVQWASPVESGFAVSENKPTAMKAIKQEQRLHIRL
jgi:hypothetical protein